MIIQQRISPVCRISNRYISSWLLFLCAPLILREINWYRKQILVISNRTLCSCLGLFEFGRDQLDEFYIWPACSADARLDNWKVVAWSANNFGLCSHFHCCCPEEVHSSKWLLSLLNCFVTIFSVSQIVTHVRDEESCKVTNGGWAKVRAVLWFTDNSRDNWAPFQVHCQVPASLSTTQPLRPGHAFLRDIFQISVQLNNSGCCPKASAHPLVNEYFCPNPILWMMPIKKLFLDMKLLWSH